MPDFSRATVISLFPQCSGELGISGLWQNRKRQKRKSYIYDKSAKAFAQRDISATDHNFLQCGYFDLKFGMCVRYSVHVTSLISFLARLSKTRHLRNWTHFHFMSSKTSENWISTSFDDAQHAGMVFGPTQQNATFAQIGITHRKIVQIAWNFNGILFSTWGTHWYTIRTDSARNDICATP